MGDGNGNSKGRDNKPVWEVKNKPNIDGSWGFKQQIGALKNSCDAEVDLTFKESTVKDVSDSVRAKSAAKLQEMLAGALKQPPSSKRKASIAFNGVSASVGAGAAGSSHGGFELPEPELRLEVKGLVQQLQRLRQDPNCEARSAAVIDILQQLEQLPITVSCLKATKIGAELNEPCWRTTDNSKEVKGRAAALVRRWRSMYRAENGNTDGVSVAAHERRCRNLSMDLEESAYSQVQRLSFYDDLILSVCELLKRDVDATRALMDGAITTKDFVGRVAGEVKRRQAQRM